MIRLARIFLVLALFCFALSSVSAYAALTPEVQAQIQAAVDSGDNDAIIAAVTALSKSNPDLAAEIGKMAAGIAPRSLVAGIANAAIAGSGASAQDAGNIVGSVASAINATSKELSQLISEVSVAQKMNADQVGQMTKVAEVVGIGLPYVASLETASGGNNGGDDGAEGATPPSTGENPNQDADSLQ